MRGPVRAFDGNDGRIKRFGGPAESLEDLGNGAAGTGIVKTRGDFVEGNEDEGALSESRVRELKSVKAEDEVVVKNEIEIEGARTVGDGEEAVAAEGELDFEK